MHDLKNPILLDFPLPIQTKRLLLRPLMPGDGKKIFEAIEESKDLFTKWLPWVKDVKKWEDSEKTAREFYADFILRKRFPLVILKDDALIGMCGFNTIKWTIPSASIGYWCRKNAQGNGYMKESVEALTIYGFNSMHLKRLSICCKDTNKKSISVAESLGFTLETCAKGLLENLEGEDLVYARRYVRFNADGLGTQGGYGFR